MTHTPPRAARTSLLAIVSVGLVATALPTTAATGAPAAPSAAAVQLRADSNRDGRVDVKGRTDLASKTTATTARGALFLPNLDDDAKRCKGRLAVIQCSDAGDARVNNAEDAKDLAPVLTVPAPQLSARASGTIRLEGRGGAARTRIFLQRAGRWQVVDAKTRLTATELRRGVRLALEGRDVVRHAPTWDGTVTVRLDVTDGGKRSTDRVQLRQAPMLTHTHGQQLQRLITSPGRDKQGRGFTQQLRSAAARSKVAVGDLSREQDEDRWTQDWVEPFYVSMPSQLGKTQQMRILLRSDQDRPVTPMLFGMKAPGVGVVQLSKTLNGGTRSSFGNLETIPAYKNGSQVYSAGRMIYGVQAGVEAPSGPTLNLLRSQGAQAPLALDTSWLTVGHVDEFIQFLPAKNARGWTIAVADPAGANQLMRDAAKRGHGKVRIYSHKEAQPLTINQFLADKGLQQDQGKAASRINAALKVVQRATGVKDSEVVRVPVLYGSELQLLEGGGHPGSVDRLNQVAAAKGPQAMKKLSAARTPQEKLKAAGVNESQMSALLPAAINSVVASPSRMIVAQQFGPRIGGRDIMDDAVRRAYGRAGLSVDFVDDYLTYHLGQGDVHCGTNSLRAMPGRWW